MSTGACAGVRIGRIVFLVVALTLALALTPVGAARADVVGYYKAPWSPVVYEVQDDGTKRPIDFAEWEGLGSPAPQVAPVRYVKTLWAPVVYGLITWPETPDDAVVDEVHVLTWAEYDAARQPGVTIVGHVPGTTYLRWSSSTTERFARTPDASVHRLTEVEWRAAGRPATPVETRGFYRVIWSDIVHEVTATGAVRRVGFVEWTALGSPTPGIAPEQYVKTTWSPTVYGLISWPDATDDYRVDQVAVLSPDQYARAGLPAVASVGHVETSTYLRYRSGEGERFVRTPDGATHKLTGAEWTTAGPQTVADSPRGFYRAAWSPVVHEVLPTGAVRQVGFPEWVTAGMPTPALAPVQYVKTAWSPAVYGLITWPNGPADTAVDQVAGLAWADYVAAGRPAIAQATRIPGDSILKFTVGPTIFHVVLGVATPLTSDQWISAGQPVPQIIAPPAPAYIRGVLVVNKSLPIPSWYGGGLAPELSSAFAAMRSAAGASGLSLYISSGYRSFGAQQSLYGRFAASEGVAGADTHSARAGHSEHQTGLAIDINTVAPSFAGTAEGRWVAANAHIFGFIVRYPAGKEHITGYMYEPWHLRYVGPELATLLFTSGLTLEEYMMVPSHY